MTENARRVLVGYANGGTTHWQLWEHTDKRTKVKTHASAPALVTVGKEIEVSFRFERGKVTVTVNGQLLLQKSGLADSSGSVGFGLPSSKWHLHEWKVRPLE